MHVTKHFVELYKYKLKSSCLNKNCNVIECYIALHIIDLSGNYVTTTQKRG